MRTNRIELIGVLKNRRDALIKAAGDRYADEMAKERNRERAYLEQTGEEWAKLAERIKRRVAAQEPVRSEDIPDVLRQGGYLGYRAQKVTLQNPNTGALDRLITLLEASPDETVSVPSLERAGFSLGTLLK